MLLGVETQLNRKKLTSFPSASRDTLLISSLIRARVSPVCCRRMMSALNAPEVEFTSKREVP